MQRDIVRVFHVLGVFVILHALHTQRLKQADKLAAISVLGLLGGAGTKVVNQRNMEILGVGLWIVLLTLHFSQLYIVLNFVLVRNPDFNYLKFLNSIFANIARFLVREHLIEYLREVVKSEFVRKLLELAEQEKLDSSHIEGLLFDYEFGVASDHRLGFVARLHDSCQIVYLLCFKLCGGKCFYHHLC